MASSISSLSPHQRALIAMAVLIDGADAIEFLSDKIGILEQGAQELVALAPEVRVSAAALLLRDALAEISGASR